MSNLSGPRVELINETSFSIPTRDQLMLHGQWQQPSPAPAAVVVGVHGFGEHHRRHDRPASALLARNLAVVRYDLRGHGLSMGTRGDTPSYEHLLDDLDAVLDLSHRRWPNLPLVLFGHSLGGGLVANWCIRRPGTAVCAAVLSSPWFRLRKRLGPWTHALVRMAARWMPTVTVSTGIRAENLASDPESMSAYRRDPLVIKRMTLRMVLAAIDGGERALNEAAACRLPLAVVCGTGDRIVDPAAIEEFARRAPQVELRTFPGLAHELHFESSAEEVLEYIAIWIERRLTLNVQVMEPPEADAGSA